MNRLDPYVDVFLRDRVAKAWDEVLTEREQIIVVERIHGATLQEIGEKVDLSRERARQLYEMSLKKLYAAVAPTPEQIRVRKIVAEGAERRAKTQAAIDARALNLTLRNERDIRRHQKERRAYLAAQLERQRVAKEEREAWKAAKAKRNEERKALFEAIEREPLPDLENYREGDLVFRRNRYWTKRGNVWWTTEKGGVEHRVVERKNR